MKPIVLLLLSILIFQCSTPQKKQGTAPNIIVFLVDDMGWQETSVPFYTDTTELNRRFRTPNMERLAEKGMMFTQAYASAVCSPSRVSLITGTNPAQHNVTCWTLYKDWSPEGKNADLEQSQWNLNGLSPEPGIERTFYFPETLPKLLKEAGYRSIHVGKAHFGAIGTPGEEPLNLGFDVNIGGHAAGGPGSYYGDKNFSGAWRGGGPEWDVPGLEKYFGQEINLTEALTLEAMLQMDSSVQNEQPFFLYLSHYTVHAPWEADRRFVDNYTDLGLSERLTAHASMIESMDKSLGDILDKVESLGISENTYIVFISDNGQPSQMTPNLPLRGHKITAYEGGLRVPMIVAGPRAVKMGTRNPSPVAIQDIYATALDIAKISDKQPALSDSHSFLPALNGTSINDERALVWHYPNYYDEDPYSVIRKGDWKLIYFYKGTYFELYNLHNDIGENSNLANSHPEKTRELAKELGKFLRESKAVRPVLKESGSEIAWPDEV